ncbi:MAG TPA: hypothetical protein VIX18_02745 [Nitrospirota bacterium]
MIKDKSTFGIRFGSNEDLAPSQDELAAFLQSPKNGRGQETHGSDLAAYEKLLENVQAFEQNQRQDVAPDISRRMFYQTLSLSQFFNPGLSSAVAQYKYQMHKLATLDFRKPAAFIKSAEEEMKKLNPKKSADAVKLAKFQEMIEERNRAIATLTRARTAIPGELVNIAGYIRDNLAMIRAHCEASIMLLVDLHISRKKEEQLVEDLKTHFKEHLRDSLQLGPVTRQYAETVKQDVSVLSKELSDIVRADIYSVTQLFEAIHDRAKLITGQIESLLSSRRGGAAGVGDQTIFAKIEQVLVTLVSECRFDFEPAVVRSDTAHEQLLGEKRKELLDHVFDLLQKERRQRMDRRSGEDRRQAPAPEHAGGEQRSGRDRRAHDRRKD